MPLERAPDLSSALVLQHLRLHTLYKPPQYLKEEEEEETANIKLDNKTVLNAICASFGKFAMLNH